MAKDALPVAALLESYAALHRRLRETVTGLDQRALGWTPALGANPIAVIVTHALGSQVDWLQRAAGREHGRDRDAEFRAGGRSAVELLADVERAEALVPELVRAAVAAGLDTVRRTRDGREVSVLYCLVHAIEHTAEHVGHVELTRQLAPFAAG